MRTLWHIINDLETSLDNDGITDRTWKYLKEARENYLKDDIGVMEIKDKVILFVNISLLVAAFIAGALVF